MTSMLDEVMPVFPQLRPGHDVVLGILPFYHIYG
jgi:hypothetical protein